MKGVCSILPSLCAAAITMAAGAPPVPSSVPVSGSASGRPVPVAAPFLVSRFDHASLLAARASADLRLIAPLGNDRWLIRAEGATPGAELPGGGVPAEAFDLFEMLDRDLWAFAEAGLAGVPTASAEIVLIPADRTRAVRRRIDALARAGSGSASLIESDSLVMHATVTGTDLARLMLSGDVLWAEPKRARESDDSFVREFGGANIIERMRGYTGAGVVVEVVDRGLFTDHVDLLASSPYLRTDNGGPTDHGTATYGIVFGDGSAERAARGMMPGHHGLFSSYLAITDRNEHLRAFASDYGGVIQSNSWGSSITRRYNAVSADLDESILRHGVIVFQSQSNRGGPDSRPEAWAKNAISVGGVNGIGTLDRADDTRAGDASTGPAVDGRIKPDLVLFNDGILTTSDEGVEDHIAFTGTSAATPAVAGHAGVMIEMWRAGVFHADDPSRVPADRPSVAMARALMINGAIAYPFTSVADDLGRYRQGWGTPDLLTLWGSAPAKWLTDEEHPLRTGQAFTRVLGVPHTADRLALTLSWVDPAAMPFADRALINDLDLRVTSPSGKIYLGNHGLHDGNASLAGGSPDRVNTTENVFIPDPEPGFWQIEVRAPAIVVDAWEATPEIDAAFALVATGGLPLASDRSVRPIGELPEVLDPIRSTPVVVEVNGFQPSGTGEMRFRYGNSIAAVPLSSLGNSRYGADVSGFDCRTDYEYRFDFTDRESGSVGYPAMGWLTARGGRERVIHPTSLVGFTTEVSDSLICGGWEHAAPSGGGLRWDPPFDADGDGVCWLTENRPGESGVVGGTATLTTPPLPIATLEGMRAEFDLWLACEDAGTPAEDTMLVEISYDLGLTWETLAEERSTFRWARRSYPIETDATTASLRFTVSDGGDGSVVEAGIDGITFRGLTCPFRRPDMNQDGIVDLLDLSTFIGGFVDQNQIADMNGDGAVDLADLVIFVREFLTANGG